MKKQGLEAFKQGNYYRAAEFFQESIKRGGKNDTVLFFLAEAKRKVNYCGDALQYYLELSQKDSTTFPQAVFYAGLMYKRLGQYDKSQDKFLEYSILEDQSIPEERLEQEIKSCNVARELIKDTINVDIEDPGEHINSHYTDFGAVQLSDQSIYFSSLRPVSDEESSGLIPRDFRTDIYKSRVSTGGYSPGRRWNSPVNHKRKHTANIAFNQDENLLYFTRCDRVDGEMVCHIYYSEKNARSWGTPQKLPGIINKAGYTSTHPHITKTAGQPVLYYTSDRPGGQGGLDIWYSIIQNGEYTTPVNLGTRINTPGD
ncbi:MAG: hypothetical protein R6U19_00085, partial [Bacteroidales bacterium]